MALGTSGSRGRNAAVWTAQYLGGVQNQVLDVLNKGKTGAIDWLLGQEGGPGREGNAYDTLTGGYGSAMDRLQEAYGTMDAYYRHPVNLMQEMADMYRPARDMYYDALGLGGAEGSAKAREAFQTSPGYQFEVDEATKAAQRAANRTGNLYGGNTTDAVTRLGQNLASKEWGGWMDRLAGQQSLWDKTIGNLASAWQALGGVQGKTGEGLAGLETGLADKLSQLYGGAAQGEMATAGNAANVMMKIAESIAKAGQQGMMAGDAAEKNQSALLMGGLDLAGKALGGISGSGGLGNFISSIFK